jgi:hypothetical protein
MEFGTVAESVLFTALCGQVEPVQRRRHDRGNFTEPKLLTSYHSGRPNAHRRLVTSVRGWTIARDRHCIPRRCSGLTSKPERLNQAFDEVCSATV